KIDVHMSARPDRATYSFSLTVEHVAGAIDDVLAWTLVVNHEGFGRLIACRLASFNAYSRGLSSYCKSLLDGCSLRNLSESQRRDECAAGDTDDYLLHNYYSFL